jgi:hypothetical protein
MPSEVRPLTLVISFLLNAPTPIDVRLPGSIISVRALFLKAQLSIEVRAVQALKSMLVMPLYPKASYSIVVKTVQALRSKLVRELSLKADLPTEVKVEGKTTFVIPFID